MVFKRENSQFQQDKIVKCRFPMIKHAQIQKLLPLAIGDFLGVCVCMWGEGRGPTVATGTGYIP